MNVKNEVHRSLLLLLDEWSADRWDAIEADIRRRKLQVVPPKKPRLKKHWTRLLLCAVLSVTLFGMMLNLPFVSNWFATQTSVPVESKPLSQDKIVVNEVVKGSLFFEHLSTKLDIVYRKELSLGELMQYLGYDICPSNYPDDLFFEYDAFTQKPPKAEYDADGDLVNILYSKFIYTSTEIATRRFVIWYSKISTQVGDTVYSPKNDSAVYTQSVINGLHVKIGHLSTLEMFDGYTQKLPTERYVAEFTIHGINIQVTADNLTLEEFVAVIKSMIR